MIIASDITFEAVRLPGPRQNARYRILVTNNSSEFLETEIQCDTRKSGVGILERAGFGISLPPNGSRSEDLRPSEEHDAFDVICAFKPSLSEGWRVHSGIKIKNATV